MVGYTKDPGFMQISGWLVRQKIQVFMQISEWLFRQEIQVFMQISGSWINRRSGFDPDLKEVGNTENPGFMQISERLVTQKIQV